MGERSRGGGVYMVGGVGEKVLIQHSVNRFRDISKNAKSGTSSSPHHLDFRAFSMFTPQEPDQVSEEISRVPAHALYTFRLEVQERTLKS